MPDCANLMAVQDTGARGLPVLRQPKCRVLSYIAALDAPIEEDFEGHQVVVIGAVRFEL
jgi:hypothetical protein